MSEPVKKASIPLLNAISLYFIFPLHPGITIPAVIAGILSVATWPSFGFPRLASRTWSIALLVGGMLWAILSPYLVLSGTVYFYRADSNDPRQSEVLALGGSTDAGHLVYLTDPIRASVPVWKAMKLMGFGVELMERVSDYDPPVILMPLSGAVRYRKLGTGTPTFAEELITSYTGTGLSVEVYRWSTAPHTMVGVGVTASSFSLVDYVRSIDNSPDLPWNAVIYARESEKRTAKYAAELDLALQAASSGDFQSAIGTLESAFQTAPSALERARLYTLLGSVSSAVIGGNIGDAQGLAFFNQAMRYWPRAALRNRLNRAQLDSPVDRWLFDRLKTAFFLRENEYPTWAKVVGDSDPRLRLATAHKSGNLTSGWVLNYMPQTPTAAESLIGADKQRLIGLVKRSTGNPDRLSTELKEFVTGASPHLVHL